MPLIGLSLAAAGISAGASIFGSILGARSSSKNRQQQASQHDQNMAFQRDQFSWQQQTDKRNFEAQQHWNTVQDQWAWRQHETEQSNRLDDIQRAESWRAEDIERSSIQYQMRSAKEAGLHGTAMLGGGAGGGGTVRNAPMTTSGGRLPRPQTGGTGGGGGFHGAQSTPVPEEGAGGLHSLAATSMEFSNQMMQKKLIEAQIDGIRAENRLLDKQSENFEEAHQWNIKEIQSRITSSNVGDTLTERQTELIAEEVRRWRHDNDIYARNPDLLSTSNGFQEAAVNILRNIISAFNDTDRIDTGDVSKAESVMRSVGLGFAVDWFNSIPAIALLRLLNSAKK